MGSISRPFRVAVALTGVLTACGLGQNAEGRHLVLRSLGGESLSQLPLVPRLLLRAELAVGPENFWLVRGRVSDKELAQVLAGEPSQALQERRLPLAAWSAEDGLTLAPLTVLEPSQDYTIVALQLGELARLGTMARAAPLLWRWGSTSVASGSWVVHCIERAPWSIGSADVSIAESVQQVLLEPEGHRVDALVEFFDDGGASTNEDEVLGASGCVRFQVPEGARSFLPPLGLAGYAFEPAVFTVEEPGRTAAAGKPTVRTIGSAAFVDLPPSFAQLLVRRVGDDDEARPIVEDGAPGAAGAGSADGRVGSLVRAWSKGAATVPLGQFAPGSYLLSITGFDAGGFSTELALPFEISEERGFLVLNEVMTNPLGPEPDSEWVEVVNIGRAPLSLEGYFLEDADEATPLPPVVLPPGGVGLVVASTFTAGLSGDIVPAADAIPIVVDAIGDGLTNSGEAIRLRAPSGEVTSEIPAQSSEAGQSVARRHLLAPDWTTSFTQHAAPGASPGGSNRVD